MAFTVIQAGTALQFVDFDGTLTTLTLPSGVTLRSDVPPRWAIYGNFIILVNTPSTPLTIDSTGTVRVFVPAAPRIAPVVSAGATGTLTGTYAGIRYTFIVKDTAGTVIAESDYSPASNSVAITSKNLKAAGLDISANAISARRLYRPTTGGTTLFPWLDVEGNTITEVQDDLSDAGLSLIAAPSLGNPPRMTLIKEWRNLLWGVGDTAIDTLVFSQPDAFYAFPAENTIQVSGSGRDRFGVRSLMPRREALGVGRRDQIWQVTGSTADDFRLVKLSENTGIESNESMVVYRDTVFWLWKDGVYQWDSNGIRNISDGAVSSWFKTDSYFNQNMFANAFAVFEPTRLKYRLYLAAAGSTSIDRWIEYDVQAQTWWGPHKTGAFSPTSAFLLQDTEDKVRAIAGSSSGFIWQDNTLNMDTGTSANTPVPIDFDVDTRFYDGGAADLEKYWGELSVVGKVQERPLAIWLCEDPVGGITEGNAPTTDGSGHGNTGYLQGYVGTDANPHRPIEGVVPDWDNGQRFAFVGGSGITVPTTPSLASVAGTDQITYALFASIGVTDDSTLAFPGNGMDVLSWVSNFTGTPYYFSIGANWVPPATSASGVGFWALYASLPLRYEFTNSGVDYGFEGAASCNVFTTTVDGTVPLVTIAPFTWYHLALTYDGQRVTLYVNGVAITSAVPDPTYPAPFTLPPDIGGLSMGSTTFPLDNNWFGSLSEVVIYKSAKTADEIAALYRTRAALTTKNFSLEAFPGAVVTEPARLAITPKTGYLNSSVQAPISYDMTKGRQRLRRIGTGKLMQLNLRHNVAYEGVELYGFELPYSVIGRR